MRKAVAGRPVEKFDTELKLPEWQLEPDDEYLYSDPDDYFYVDEDGNLIGPESSRPDANRSGGSGNAPDGGEPRPFSGNGGLVPVEPPPAANDDFLDRATGRKSQSPGREDTNKDPGLRPAPAGGGAPANLLPGDR